MKYIVVLNVDPRASPIYYVVTTSNAARFESGRFEESILRVPPGKMEALPEGTIIDCIKVHALSREALKKWFLKGAAKLRGHLSGELLSCLDRVLHQSPRIEENLKPRIIPGMRPRE